MKKKIFYPLVLGILAIGCKKDVIDPVTPPTNSTPLSDFFSSRAPAVQTFTINASQTNLITGTQGTRIFIYGNSFLTQSNQPVTGNITIKLQEVYSKKDMIYTGAFTVADGKPLISGGEFNLTAWQGNQELKLNPSGYIQAGVPSGNNPSGNMSEFYAATLDANNDFNALDTTQNIPVVIDSLSGQQIYTFQIDSLDWINCDYFMGLSQPQTNFAATLPAQFDNTNCHVFLAFNGQNSAAKFYNYDALTNQMSVTPYYTLPVGMQVTFVAIAKIGNQYYSAFQSTSIVNNHNEQLNLQPATEAQIEQQLNSLQ